MGVRKSCGNESKETQKIKLLSAFVWRELNESIWGIYNMFQEQFSVVRNEWLIIVGDFNA